MNPNNDIIKEAMEKKDLKTMKKTYITIGRNIRVFNKFLYGNQFMDSDNFKFKELSGKDLTKINIKEILPAP